MIRQFNGILITGKNYNDILQNEGRSGLRFHHKHLKAYKRGVRSFTHGKRADGSPLYHMVQETWV